MTGQGMFDVLATAVRALTFRATGEELRNLDHWHLALGLILTWLVGVGRWWEDPKAHILQHLGVGSLVYVLLLSLFLWLIIRPLAAWARYPNVFTYITLTAPPAILYAVPVRSWFDIAVAQQVRLWFLAIVATWRVLLWARYLVVGIKLSWTRAVVGTLFPLTMIIVALSMLNLERVVFDLMGGNPHEATVNDAAYGVLFFLSLLSGLLFVPLAVAYGVLVFRRSAPDISANGSGVEV
jgi:hypothetical protein